MPRRYPVEFRRKSLDLIEAGRPVAEIADQLGDHGGRRSTTGGTRIKSIEVSVSACRRASRRS